MYKKHPNPVCTGSVNGSFPLANVGEVRRRANKHVVTLYSATCFVPCEFNVSARKSKIFTTTVGVFFVFFL